MTRRASVITRMRAGSLSVFDDEIEHAAALIAQCLKPHAAIAKELGITHDALRCMMRDPEFIARVAELRNDYREAVRERGITEVLNRVQALDDMWKRARQVIEERACDEDLASVPGGSTGLLVRRTKTITRKDGSSIVIEEVSADTALMKEMRAISKQAAQELGQWVDQHQHDVTSGNRPVSLLASAVIVPAVRIAETPEAHALDPPDIPAHAQEIPAPDPAAHAPDPSPDSSLDAHADPQSLTPGDACA